MVSRGKKNHMDLTKLWQQPQREQQKSNRFDEQNNNSAYASRFFELSLQRPEMTKF